MSYLRDFELRWGGDGPHPVWWWRIASIQYFFVKEIKRLKIETPGIVKINAWVGKAHRAYSGECFDKVTDIYLANKFSEDSDQWPVGLFADFCMDLMLEALSIFLRHFAIVEKDIDVAASKAKSLALKFSIPISKILKLPEEGFSARLMLHSGFDLNYCSVVLSVTDSHGVVFDFTVCTTFPSPDYALDGFRSMCFDKESTSIVVTFRVAGSFGKILFGRANFDHSGLEGIRRFDNTIPSAPYYVEEPSFFVCVSDVNN